MCFVNGVWHEVRTKTRRGAQNWRQFTESRTPTCGKHRLSSHRTGWTHESRNTLSGDITSLICFLISSQLLRTNREGAEPPPCWREAVVSRTSPGFNSATCACCPDMLLFILLLVLVTDIGCVKELTGRRITFLNLPRFVCLSSIRMCCRPARLHDKIALLLHKLTILYRICDKYRNCVTVPFLYVPGTLSALVLTMLVSTCNVKRCLDSNNSGRSEGSRVPPWFKKNSGWGGRILLLLFYSSSLHADMTQCCPPQVDLCNYSRYHQCSVKKLFIYISCSVFVFSSTRC